MAPRSIPDDTDPAVFALLVEHWRSMTVEERVAITDQASADVHGLAVAGILASRPNASDVEVRHELARRRYGADLADRAYRDLLV